MREDVSGAAGALPGRSSPAEDADVLANIAEDYYIDGLTQDAIAKRYRISRSYVSRLLRRAREVGLVEVKVHREIRRDKDLETALEQRFRLEHCLVAEGSADPDGSLRHAGQLAAGLLARVLEPDGTFGLGWGHAVRSTVAALVPGRAVTRRVVQLFGGLSAAPATIMSGELVTEAARALDAEADRLHAPWIVETPELARSLLDSPDIASVLHRAAAADVALGGIGATGRPTSALLFNDRYLDEHELREIQALGAVGDICGRLFDEDGQACLASAMDRVIGLELTTIRRIPLVIGVATGRQKARAIRGALRGGLIHALVTDSLAAREVLRADAD